MTDQIKCEACPAIYAKGQKGWSEDKCGPLCPRCTKKRQRDVRLGKKQATEFVRLMTEPSPYVADPVDANVKRIK